MVLQSKDGRLNVTGFVFVGGLPKRVQNVLRRYKPSPNLRGCLRNVSLDGWQVLLSPRKPDRYYKVYGSPQQKCQHREFETLSFSQLDSYLYMPWTNKGLLDIDMWLRTYLDDTLSMILTGSGPLVKVSIRGGQILLDVQLALVRRFPTFTLGQRVNNGEWHRLSVVMKGKWIQEKTPTTHPFSMDRLLMTACSTFNILRAVSAIYSCL